jgi:hypothetical protein
VILIFPEIGSAPRKPSQTANVPFNEVKICPAEVVVPMAEAVVVLQRAQRLLETEHLLQENIKAGGTTIGELAKVDEIFRTTFSYQNKDLERKCKAVCPR